MHFLWESVIPLVPFCKKWKSQVSSSESRFNTPRADTAHLLHLRHTSLIIRRESGIQREQGEGDYQPPEELGMASSAVFCVWRHKVTKFGKVRTAGQTSCITPLQGMGMEESVCGFSALSTVWRILNTGAMTPASSWFICNICGEIHSLERNYLRNSFYPMNCWIFSTFLCNTCTQNAFVELNWKDFHLNWLTILTWLGLIGLVNSKYFDFQWNFED